jgi:hypothetical protein
MGSCRWLDFSLHEQQPIVWATARRSATVEAEHDLFIPLHNVALKVSNLDHTSECTIVSLQNARSASMLFLAAVALMPYA